MVFCIKHSEKSIQIITILNFFMILVTDQEKKLAIFYLISDIIHNSLLLSYPHLVKASLPFVFQKLNGVLSNEIKKKFNAVLQLWRNKVIFDDDFLEGLEFLLFIDSKQCLSIPNQIIQKTHQQIFNQCRRFGLPRNKQSLLTLSKFMNQRKIKNQSKKEINQKPKEGLYDGIPLTQEEIYKIRHNIIKVVTFHNVSYLDDKFKSFSKSFDEQI